MLRPANRVFRKGGVAAVARGARPLGLLLAAAVLLAPTVAGAITVVIPASKDNTLYESTTGATSNGVGEYIFTGRTKDGVKRRAVIAFDIAANIPAGATINSVSLQLNLSRVANNTLRTTTLHRLLADWGEGTSNAAQNEGQGAPSTANDATWIHRFYTAPLWSAAGGDFSATASASTGVTGNGNYTWSSPTMVTDIQSWLDAPTTNFGWLVRGDESVIETAKRFGSSENAQTSQQPALTVDYSVGGGATGACCQPSGTCSTLTASQCASAGGTYQGDGTSCTPNPCPVVTSIPASEDNTLYESPSGSLSNGAGTKFLTSKNGANLLRRGLIRFDLSSIPAGSTLQSATLTLYNVEATNSATVTLYRATSTWGEGTSLATGNEDGGAAPTNGDATWIHRFYPGTNWAAAGGDFSATVTASATVVGAGSYSWSSAQLLADVQGWLNAPATNAGWVIRGKESGAGNALKRFESRQSSDVVNRPRLNVSYIAPPPVPTGACCLPSGTCDTLSAAQCSAAGGVYQGDGSTCTTGLCPVVLAPYVDSLPRPAVATPTIGVPGGAASYDIPIREFSQRLHRDLPLTRVWGYANSYPGPTIEASTGNPVTVTWINDLRDSLGALRTTHYLPVDLCLTGPDSAGPTPRVISHLHGGHVPAAVDGHPDSTFLPGEQVIYTYPNNQQAGTLWYHDHAMGITRLNVMMGLAGFYLVRDPAENALGLPSGEFEIPLAMQDRAFNSNGTLQYPEMWMDHFFGDKMLVNGKVWPYLRVKQGKYRFRMLNGCNSRVLRLSLSNGAPFTIIGTELGLLPAPVTRSILLLSSGERADVILDFSGYAPGTQIVLANDAPAPYPGNPGVGVIPNVMRFEVIAATGHTAPVPSSLRPVPRIDSTESVLQREFVLRKTTHPCTGNVWLINGLHFSDVTEHPVLGTTEIWRFVNQSGVSHPMHMHLVAFQVLDRQPFVLQNGQIVPTGPPVPPDSSEAGWKDTAPVEPNEMLRVIARFESYAGHYAYHCHILEHEDHEMMRQFRSVPAPTLSVGDATVTEGNAGTVTASFTVSLSSAVESQVRVVAFTEDISATAGADYVALPPDTLLFPPLSTTQSVNVTVNGDLTDEFDETFRLRLTAPAVAVLGDSVAVGTITDDDAPPTLSVGDVTLAEGNAGTTSAVFTVSLSARSEKPVQVEAATADGSALAGQDYVAISPPTVVSYAAGDTNLTRTVAVSVVGDAVVEPDENFVLNLSSPQNATLADGSGTGTIVNDDGVPMVAVNDVSVAEGDAGTATATFSVTLSAPSASPVEVVAETRDSSAVAGPDYVAVGPDTLRFSPLVTSLPFQVQVVGDVRDEFEERFHIRLLSAQAAVVADSVGNGTILDDDPEPLLSIDDVTTVEGNTPDTTWTAWTVSLSAVSGKPIQALVATAEGSALGGTDFVPLGPLAVVFPADSANLARVVSVGVLGDLLPEPSETYFVRLSGAQNVVIADSSGLGIITNDDGGVGVPTDQIPAVSFLGPGRPNPSFGRVLLQWGLTTAGRAELAIFDIHGRLLRRGVDGEQPAGTHSWVWDGRDDRGNVMPSGLYLIRLKTPVRTFQRAVVLLR